MDKKSKDTIKEVIEELLKLRTEKLHQDRIVQLSSYSSDKKNYDDKRKAMKKHQLKTISMFDKPLVKLNHLLDKKEQNKEVIDLEQQMKKIQAKKYISVKELSEIYNISKTSQQNYRSRLHDSLPYHQKVEGGKITYIVEEIEKWLENQHR